MNSDCPYSDETYRIIGACFEVYNEKGCGLLEPVYQECLAIELGLQDIPFAAETTIEMEYKGHRLKKRYEPDFVCFNEIVVEIKAVAALCDQHRAQIINYLKASGMEVGLLINFGHYPKLEYERFANTMSPHLRQSASSAGRPEESCPRMTRTGADGEEMICVDQRDQRAGQRRVARG